MKRQGKIILFTAFLSVLLWSCAKNNDLAENISLKEAINQSALNLNNAMDVISLSKAFTILTVNEGTQKSSDVTDPLYRVYIPLDSIKGVYEYHPVERKNRWGISLLRYFSKSTDDSKMVVKIPLKKIEHPWSLRHYTESDSLLTNNFSITVSEYHNNYNSYHDFDYLLASEISINDTVRGELNIDYFVSPSLGTTYASQYAFTDKYTADYKYKSGDTTISSFAISEGVNVLYEEKRLTIRNDTARFGREHQYVLTIGDVKIVRKSETHAVEVYVNDILQINAVVEIVDHEADPEASVCRKRDIQITFDDGTTATVSALIGKSVNNIKTLFNSLHQVYFAAYVVDWIAYDIYYQRN
ncbi:MAG: hypothetical protein WCS03_03765 [Bacteroidota bacterium]